MPPKGNSGLTIWITCRFENAPSKLLGGSQRKTRICVLKLHFIIPIEPEGKKEARRARFGVYKHPDTRRKMLEIAASIRSQYKGDPLDGPLRLEIVAFKKRPKSKPRAVYADTKPDYDNIEKLIGDALEGILWVNDSRIVDGHCVKKFAPQGQPGWIEITVSRCLPAAV